MRNVCLAMAVLVAVCVPAAGFDDETAPTLAALDAGIARKQAAIAAHTDDSCSPDGIGKTLSLMFDVDQYALKSQRTICPDLSKDCSKAVIDRAMKLDLDNRARLKAMLARVSWSELKTCGPTAQHYAWLLVQHADNDVAFQAAVLGQMKAALLAGAASANDYAYLVDRVAVNSNKPQVYGTQGRCEGTVWMLKPLAAPEGLGARRHEMRMWTMTFYQNLMNGMCTPPKP